MLAFARTLSPKAVRSVCSFYRHSHAYAPTCVPVVVVGAGPTGLVLSCLLSQYGIRHVVLERSQQLTQHPQAHYINNRTMEVFRGLPGLSAQVQEVSPPLSEWRRFLYCESMAAGQLLGEVDHFPGQTEPQDTAISPEPVTHLSQHRLLPLLLQQAQQLSAANGNCADIQFGRAVTSISNVEFPHHLQQHMHLHPHLQHHIDGGHSDQHAAAVAQDAAAQQGQHHQQQQCLEEDLAAQEYPVCVAVEQQAGAAGAGRQLVQLVRCSYLVAADGAHSNIRTLLSIPLLGAPDMQHLMSIHFSWPQLGRALLTSGRPAMLYFVFNRELVAVVVAHDLQRGEFVAQVPYYPPLQSPADFTPDVCKQLITAAAGWSQQQPASAIGGSSGSSSEGGLQLHSVKNWVMGALVAQDYAAWGGRVLLVGDAAHRFPPAGGFGMNTGIQDAHNLAWKLAAVVSGVAQPHLLSTYATERRPVATANAQLSINNWHEAIKVPQALGLDPQAAELVNKLVAAAPLPGEVGKWLLDSTLAAGRGLAAAVTPLRKGVLEEILKSGQSLKLQFSKEDLGFVYRQGAVVGEDGEKLMPGDSSSSSGRGRGSSYGPSTAVGGRLPHCWLALPGQQGGQQRVSTLDLTTADTAGLNMLLICSRSSGSSGVAQPAATAAASGDIDWLSTGLQLQQQGWPLRVLRILPQGTQLPNDSGTTSSSSSTAAGGNSNTSWSDSSSCTSGILANLEHQLDAVDVDGTWSRLHPGCSSVALLVRPDGHVAWRKVDSGCLEQQSGGKASSGVSSSSSIGGVDELLMVLKKILHLQPPADDSD